MILEEETYKKFGYYPRDLMPHARKRILTACDECGKVREVRKNAYFSLCRSCSHSGKNNPMFGKTPSIETRKKVRDANSGEKGPRWKGGPIERACLFCGKPFFASQCEIKRGNGKYCSHSCSIRAHLHNAKPTMTHPERLFQDMCKKYNLPFTFVGNGKLWLGHANPDFIHTTRKLCVEIYGDYWHSPLLNRNISYTHTLEGRRKPLKAEGYRLIVFWGSDLAREDAGEFVLHELEKFKISSTQ